ncbi:MAG: hypothetical protein ACTSQG_04165 [Promethearchaeota archaeon]
MGAFHHDIWVFIPLLLRGKIFDLFNESFVEKAKYLNQSNLTLELEKHWNVSLKAIKNRTKRKI